MIATERTAKTGPTVRGFWATRLILPGEGSFGFPVVFIWCESNSWSSCGAECTPNPKQLGYHPGAPVHVTGAPISPSKISVEESQDSRRRILRVDF